MTRTFGRREKAFKNRIRLSSPELVIGFCLLPLLQGFSLRSLDARSIGFISQLGANYSDTSAITSPHQLMASASDACRGMNRMLSTPRRDKSFAVSENEKTRKRKSVLVWTLHALAWRDNYVLCKCVSLEI